VSAKLKKMNQNIGQTGEEKMVLWQDARSAEQRKPENLVANRLGRQYTLLELNEEYAMMATKRIHEEAPLLEGV